MFKRLKGIKDALWAAAIGVSLLALFIALVFTVFTPYHGDRERPVMDLRSGQRRAAEQKEAEAEAEKLNALKPNGNLHSLPSTEDAGEAYTDGLCYLVDSSFIGLRSAGLTTGQVWSSETGALPMASVKDWKIRYPGDGSFISPASAAMIAKPDILVIAVGSDGLTDLDESSFTENYKQLIASINAASPETRIICLSLSSVTASYIGSEGLSKDRIAEVNKWIRAVSIETGAYYGDLSARLCVDSWLRSDYADGSGRSLNSAGLSELLAYLRCSSLEPKAK